MNRGVPFARTLRRQLGRARLVRGGPSVRLADALWPESRLGEAVAGLGRASGLAASSAAAQLDVARAARALGLDAKAITADHGRIEELLRLAAPALLRVEGEAVVGYLALTGARARAVHALAPGGTEVSLRFSDVVRALRGPLERKASAPYETLLDKIGAGPARRAAALRALVGERLAAASVASGWILERSPHAPLTRHLRDAGAVAKLAWLVVVRVLHAAAWVVSWWLLGRAVFTPMPRLMLGWAVVVAALLPLRAVAASLESHLATLCGALLKRRLLAGALALDPDAIRNVGVGSLVSRIADADAAESSGLQGGVATVAGATETMVALAALTAVRPGLAALFLACCALIALARLRERGRLDVWTEERHDVTIGLVEKMIGHRTRRIQEAPELRHAGEREGLGRYLRSTARADAAGTAAALVPRAWLVGGLVAVALAWRQGADAAAIAAAAGAVWLGENALEKLSTSLGELLPALVAGKRLAPLLGAHVQAGQAGQAGPDGVPAWSEVAPMIELRNVAYRYPGQSRVALQVGELAVRAGDRLIIEGPSGVGKSTLAAILAGMRVPNDGALLLEGVDHRALDREDWVRRVAAVPQFHENCIYAATLKWNLLMGRPWPYDADDEREAEAVCAELGLDELIARMPAGLEQMVGEYGWQLSHGERTRVFLARALLQGSRLLVLDEPFAALDPQTVGRCLDCVTRRAPTLIVISHR